MSALLPSLQITRLLVRNGDLHAARLAAEDARLDAIILDDRAQWLEATRIYFQCCQELEEITEASKPVAEVLEFLMQTPDASLQAQAETLLSSWLLATHKNEEAQDYALSAIAKSLEIRDLETLARALSIHALSLAMKPEDFPRCLGQLNKLDVILQEITHDELKLTSGILRGYIYTQTNQLDSALDLLWNCYEQAKLHGFHAHTSSLLAQIARAYRDKKQDDQFSLYADLALKGLNSKKSPRLFKMIQAMCPPSPAKLKNQIDFQVQVSTRRVKEKTKGNIDFKNQHILFEMALMFLQKPGRRFNKEDLAQNIWNQKYSPDLHDNLIYVSIKRLRSLLEPDLESPQYILRDRKGYYFNPQATVQIKNHTEEIAPL